MAPASPASDMAAQNRQDIPLVRSALEANRTEFYLQPIVRLDDRKVMFYEGLTRLRDAQGQIIMPATYLPLAEAAGLSARIDNMLLLRCVHVIDNFIRKKYEIGVFCNFSKQALRNLIDFTPFKDHIARKKHIASYLTFEFSQQVLDDLDDVAYQNLQTLAAMGFRFSLDNITRLDMDFEFLSKLGFSYLKVDGDILYKGQDRRGLRFVTVSLAEQIRRSGLLLIAQKLETREIADMLFNYDIHLGQGYLYGKPRLIPPAAAKPQQNLAASA